MQQSAKTLLMILLFTLTLGFSNLLLAGDEKQIADDKQTHTTEHGEKEQYTIESNSRQRPGNGKQSQPTIDEHPNHEKAESSVRVTGQAHHCKWQGYHASQTQTRDGSKDAQGQQIVLPDGSQITQHSDQ